MLDPIASTTSLSGITPAPVAQTTPQTTPPSNTGLVNTINTPGIAPVPVAGSAGYTPVNTTATSYDPTNWNVDKNQTTSGQLQQVLDPNSPLMAQAASLGTEQANARGLVNSTMGITAADSAMYNAAVPIASSNAQTYANAAQTNAGATNAALQFGAGATNTALLSNQQATNTASAAASDAANKASLANAQNATSIAENIANNATNLTQTQLTTQSNQAIQLLQSQYALLGQTSSQAGGVMNQVMANIANIQNSTTMDQTSKNTAVATQLGLLTQELQAIQSVAKTSQSSIQSLDLGALFGVDTVGNPAPAAPAAPTAPAAAGNTAAAPAYNPGQGPSNWVTAFGPQ